MQSLIKAEKHEMKNEKAIIYLPTVLVAESFSFQPLLIYRVDLFLDKSSDISLKFYTKSHIFQNYSKIKKLL